RCEEGGSGQEGCCGSCKEGGSGQEGRCGSCEEGGSSQEGCCGSCEESGSGQEGCCSEEDRRQSSGCRKEVSVARSRDSGGPRRSSIAQESLPELPAPQTRSIAAGTPLRTSEVPLLTRPPAISSVFPRETSARESARRVAIEPPGELAHRRPDGRRGQL